MTSQPTTPTAWSPEAADTIPDPMEDLRRLLEGRDHHRDPAAVAHLSLLGTESCIGIYRPDRGITAMVELMPLPLRGLDLLDEIAAIDENAERLVENFAKAFPDVHRRVALVGAELDDLETSALGWLLLAARLLLGLDDDAVQRSGALGETVSLDTVVVEEDGHYLLDGRRLLRSLMSYRLADVDAALLARSVSESLGSFVADALTRLVQDWPDARTVACAGDVFAHDPLLTAWTRQGLARVGRAVLMPH